MIKRVRGTKSVYVTGAVKGSPPPLSLKKKSSFQPAGTKLRYSGFKCSFQHSEQEAFKGKTQILLPAVEGGLYK